MVYRAITIFRGVLVRLVYNETLKLSVVAAAEAPNAPATLIQADVERIGFGMRNMHEAYASSLEAIVAIYLLERQLGVAVLAPLGVIIGECFR
jgi:ATP-binding cassette, subfamily C (CFTR/MRP), member 1